MLNNTIIGDTYFLLCFNVFSYVDNLNYSEIAYLMISISNCFFNIMSLSSLMVCSFLWFLSFELLFLNDNFDIQFVSWTTSPSLYLFFSKCRFLHISAPISTFSSNFVYYKCQSHLLNIFSVIVFFLQQL